MGLIAIIYHAELDAEQAPAFPAHAAASLAATRTEIDGCLLYDTFQSADGGSVTLLELYDSNEALLRHMGALRKSGSRPPKAQSAKVLLLGDVNPELRAMFEGFGATYFGPLKQGLLSQRQTGGQAQVSDASIFVVARFTAKPGQWDEFWSRVGDVYDGVRDAEPDTVAYEWFMSEAGDEALVIDIYKDIPALQAHSANSRPRMARLREVVESSSAALYGGLPDEMVAQMTAQPGNSFHGRRLTGLV